MNAISAFMKSDPCITDIVLCGTVKAGTGNPVHRNRGSHGLVFYPEGGCDFVFAGGNTVSTKKNTVLYLPKGSDYDVKQNQQPHDCYAINFLTYTPLKLAPFSFTVRNSSFFLDAFRTADRTFRKAKSGCVMKCRSILCDIISVMQYEYSLGYIPESTGSVIAPALELIHETYTDKAPSVAELASVCGISPEYFRALFKKHSGTSPLKYINILKLTRAHELLSSKMYTVSDAALLSGFSDTSYFSREFKKHFGVPPSRAMDNA